MNTYTSEKEREYLLLNFRKMKQQLSIQDGIKYNNRHFDSNEEKSPIPYEIRLRAPSLRTIVKFKHKATYNSAQKIVDTYNALFTPSVNLKSFLSVDVFERDNPQKLQKIISGFFIGEYDCFYLSDNFENEIHGGLLEIFEMDGQYHCYLVMGLYEEHYFDTIRSKLFADKSSLRNQNKIRSRFNKYRSQLPDIPMCKNISISSGVVTQLNQSILIQVHNMNNPDHVTMLTLGTGNNKNMKNFAGGLGIYMSPTTSVLHTRVCKVLIMRSSDTDVLVNHLFAKDSQEELNNSFWMKNLKMNPTEYGRIEIVDETINKKIQSELIKISRRK